jgi:hypothetical protein
MEIFTLLLSFESYWFEQHYLLRRKEAKIEVLGFLQKDIRESVIFTLNMFK